MRTIRVGDFGEDAADVQQRLVAAGESIDAGELGGRYGASTEAATRAFQQRRGLLIDGIVGPETWGELVEAGFALGDRTLYLRNPHLRGDDVRSLQRKLSSLGFDTGREDGIFGPRCDRAVRELQRNVGREADGIVGPDTLVALERLRPQQGAVSGSMVREAEAVSRYEASLAGASIAIDPGHGPDDPGRTGPGGTTEADAARALAEALAAELLRRGAVPELLRDGDATPTLSERAQHANDIGAEVCISFHLNGHDDPGAEGATCFYFGTQETSSPAGQRLAELIQDELTARVGLMDGRVHPMAFTVLRETQMPAVQVEPCFITNAKEERLLGADSFRCAVAAAVAEGLERFFNPRGQGRLALST